MADAVTQPGARQHLAVGGHYDAFDAQRADVETEKARGTHE
jgi:hypothetical protein